MFEFFHQFWVQRFHGIVCSFALDDFDLPDDFTLVVEDLAVLVRGLPRALLGIGVFRQLANDFALVVEDFALLGDLPAFEDAHVWLDGFLCFFESFVGLGGLLDLLGLLGSLTWNDLCSANDFSFFI